MFTLLSKAVSTFYSINFLHSLTSEYTITSYVWQSMLPASYKTLHTLSLSHTHTHTHTQ